MTYICIGNLTIIGLDNGLSPGQRQAIIWTNAGIMLIGPWGTNFSEILISIQTFSFKKMHLKMSAKWQPFCLGLNVLKSFDSQLYCHNYEDEVFIDTFRTLSHTYDVTVLNTLSLLDTQEAVKMATFHVSSLLRTKLSPCWPVNFHVSED